VVGKADEDELPRDLDVLASAPDTRMDREGY
jgi:hypothetical protein